MIYMLYDIYAVYMGTQYSGLIVEYSICNSDVQCIYSIAYTMHIQYSVYNTYTV